MAAPSPHRSRRWDQRARVMALTRAAYTIGEGSFPEPHEPDSQEIGADAAPGGSTRRRNTAPRRPRRRLSARSALAVAVVIALSIAFLCVRAAVTAASIVDVPAPAQSAQEHKPALDPDGSALPGGDGSDEAQQASPLPALTPAPSPANQPTAAPQQVVVHVSGHVMAPGVVTLPAGSRVHDAVAAAGGPEGEADLDALNLARILIDGEQIHLPAPGETPPLATSGGGTQPSPSAATGLVNLNTASIEQLDALPGIGPAIAARIIEWREANGGFQDVAELDEVSGIGPSLMGSLRDLVTI